MKEIEMSDDEIESFLKTQQTGVLSLCDDDRAYGLPESFGYLDGTLYFQFGHSDDSQRAAFLDSTSEALFTTYRMNSNDDWASVIVHGSVERVAESDADDAMAALSRNADFPALHVFDPETSDIEFDLYRLTPTETSGRKGAAAELSS